MVTLADVARRANVSKMTVSRVINHPEQVTDELKELVFAAMRGLDYRPNVAAKALASNRTQLVKFFILEEISTVEPYYMNLLLGISLALSRHQYSLQLVTNNNFDIGACDGYIITGMRDSDYEWISRIEKPVVLFGENLYGYDFVDTNNKEGGMMATRYALECGYDNVVFVGIDLKEPFEYSRERGYIQVMQEHLKEPRIIRVPNHSHRSQEIIAENWDDFPINTAFICASDRIAVGIEREIQRHEADIPEKYGIIGYDGVFLDQVASPRLTTIRQDVTKQGEICGEMLLRKIEQNGSNQGFKLLDPVLVRRSTMRDRGSGEQ